MDKADNGQRDAAGQNNLADELYLSPLSALSSQGCKRRRHRGRCRHRRRRAARRVAFERRGEEVLSCLTSRFPASTLPGVVARTTRSRLGQARAAGTLPGKPGTLLDLIDVMTELRARAEAHPSCRVC